MEGERKFARLPLVWRWSQGHLAYWYHICVPGLKFLRGGGHGQIAQAARLWWMVACFKVAGQVLREQAPKP